MDTMDRGTLEGKLLPELQQIAQTMGIEGSQRLRKAGLIDAIVEASSNGERPGNGEAKTSSSRERAVATEAVEDGAVATGVGETDAVATDAGETDSVATDAGETDAVATDAVVTTERRGESATEDEDQGSPSDAPSHERRPQEDRRAGGEDSPPDQPPSGPRDTPTQGGDPGDRRLV
jgi:transcription termination factor Rho